MCHLLVFSGLTSSHRKHESVDKGHISICIYYVLINVNITEQIYFIFSTSLGLW